MIPVDFTGKVALIFGVADNESFAWYISKALNAAGAKVILAVHPRVLGIVESFLTRDMDAESRKLPFGDGSLKVEKVLPCDVRFDTMEDVDAETKADRRFAKFEEYSIKGTIDAVAAEFGGIDILIHSVAFSRDIKKKMVETSRFAYLEAMGISSYSLVSMVRYAEPHMKDRPEGGSVVGLTYIGGDRVIPVYGGGMSTCKAALQIDAAQLASNVGASNIRVNLISAGPYASRAARGIGDIQHMIDYAKSRSPLPREITPEEVANSTVFLCSKLSSGITGQILYVDNGFHVMGM
jgi:enoyl-[acyl-carrier protein] reductase I